MQDQRFAPADPAEVARANTIILNNIREMPREAKAWFVRFIERIQLAEHKGRKVDGERRLLLGYRQGLVANLRDLDGRGRNDDMRDDDTPITSMIMVNVEDLDDDGALWAKYPELYEKLERVRVRDLVMITMRELGVTSWATEHDQKERVLRITLPGGNSLETARLIRVRLHAMLGALIVVAPRLKIVVDLE